MQANVSGSMTGSQRQEDQEASGRPPGCAHSNASHDGAVAGLVSSSGTWKRVHSEVRDSGEDIPPNYKGKKVRR